MWGLDEERAELMAEEAYEERYYDEGIEYYRKQFGMGLYDSNKEDEED